MRRRTVGWLVSGMAAAVIACLTLLPFSDSPPQVWERCLICGDRGVSDAVVNVLLYLPLGAGLLLAGLAVRQALLRGALLSGTIELSQMLVPGRDPSPGDVLFNTIGVAAGIAIVWLGPLVARLTDRAAARWSLLAGALAAAVVAGTGWLLQPVFPETTYYGQWTPDLTYLEWYRGTVLSATVGDLPVRSREITEQARVRALLAEGAPIRVLGLAGPAPRRLAPLFSIYDDRQREILLVGPERNALVYRYRTRGAALRFDQPDLRVPGAMRDIRPGDTLRVEVTRDAARGDVCLTLNHRSWCRLGFAAPRGWAALYYVETFPGWTQALLDVAWIGLVFFPLGLVARRRWEWAVAAGLGMGALTLIPPGLGMLPTGVTGYLGAVAGMVVGGWAAGRLRRQLRSGAAG